MCDSRDAVPDRPRPGWASLFAILPPATAALTLIELTVAPLPLRVAAEAGIVLATFGAMALWVRANQSALDQLEVCACASEMLTIRVIRSRAEHPSRHSAVTSFPTATPVSVSPGHRTGARLGA